MRLRRMVQCNMLLSHESRADARFQMLVQKASYLARTNITTTFEEAARESRDSVAVGIDEVCKDGCEFHFLGEGGDVRVCVGEEGGEGVLVVCVDARDVGVGDDDVGEVAEGLDAVREADGEEGEGEVGGGEEGFGGEGGTAVPGCGLVGKGKGVLRYVEGHGEVMEAVPD